MLAHSGPLSDREKEALGMAVEKRRPRGLGEIYSTVLVHSQRPSELLAFSGGIGSVMTGSSMGRPNGKLDTNLHMACQHVDDDMEAIGVEWTIPAIVGTEHLDGSAREPYHTRLLDVIEFARCAFIRVYFGGEKPYAEWPVIQKPITWSVEGARQQVRFRDAVKIGRIEKFWIELSFPGPAPRFGSLVSSDASTPYRSGLEASLPVAFRFLEVADAPPALSLRPVADVLLQAAHVQHQAQDLFGRIEKLVNPNPEEDKLVADEIRELRKCFGSTAEMVDTLRAVRQGIKTK